jgi:hypothetical protein
MRGLRAKKLRSIFVELVTRKLLPDTKGAFRYLKGMYKNGSLWDIFPNM